MICMSRDLFRPITSTLLLVVSDSCNNAIDKANPPILSCSMLLQTSVKTSVTNSYSVKVWTPDVFLNLYGDLGGQHRQSYPRCFFRLLAICFYPLFALGAYLHSQERAHHSAD